jgi:hypothetical protein
MKMSPLALGGWIGMGVGAATLIAAAITGSLALSAGKEVDQQCPDGCYDTEYDLIKKRDNLSLSTDILFVEGGVLAAAGGVLVLVDYLKGNKEKENQHSVSFVPIIGNETAGASVGVRF